MKKIKIPIIIFIFLITICVINIHALSKELEVNYYHTSSADIKNAIRICQISDLHDYNYGNNQDELIKAINDSNSDLILLTGDIFDETKTNHNVFKLIDGIKGHQNIYYVTGNHEYRISNLYQLLGKLEDNNVNVLHNESVELLIKGNNITISGMDDSINFQMETWINKLNNISDSMKKSNYNILLSHRPNYIEHYKNSNFDLTLSGHNHGGQFRLPFGNVGLISPQGMFPKYTSGFYAAGDNKLFVSRGLSKSWMPRIFNRPELCIIDINPAIKNIKA